LPSSSSVIAEAEEGEEKKSRFTYQKAGNSEAHLSDVVQYYSSITTINNNNNINDDDDDITSLVNDLFHTRIYPWIRNAYLSQEENPHNGHYYNNDNDDDGNDLSLYVYDSLFIRYNATQANDANIEKAGKTTAAPVAVGAGQPLHRDLAYVSVNIMLNPQNEFEGGGTFFENQLLATLNTDAGQQQQQNDDDANDNVVVPLKPLGPGHAIAHYSSDRHSGAATYAGVRDILVVFLSVTNNRRMPSFSTKSTNRMEDDSVFQQLPPSSTMMTMIRSPPPPQWECNARLEGSCSRTCSSCGGGSSSIDFDGSSGSTSGENDSAAAVVWNQLICRMMHHRLAIDQVSDDGEAWHYSGMALYDYHLHIDSLRQRQQKRRQTTMPHWTHIYNPVPESGKR